MKKEFSDWVPYRLAFSDDRVLKAMAEKLALQGKILTLRDGLLRLEMHGREVTTMTEADCGDSRMCITRTGEVNL